MSSGLERGDRDLGAELESPATGQVGIPVDAICTGCGRIHVKRSPLESVREASTDTEPTELEVRDLTSFKHVCHRCQTATWWNSVAILSGLLESEGGE